MRDSSPPRGRPTPLRIGGRLARSTASDRARSPRRLPANGCGAPRQCPPAQQPVASLRYSYGWGKANTGPRVEARGERGKEGAERKREPSGAGLARVRTSLSLLKEGDACSPSDGASLLSRAA